MDRKEGWSKGRNGAGVKDWKRGEVKDRKEDELKDRKRVGEKDRKGGEVKKVK